MSLSNAQDPNERADAILRFWFGDEAEPGYPRRRKEWFAKDPAFDAQIRNRFLGDYEAAAAGRLCHWLEGPRSGLAFVILTDQFPRNMFRDSPQAFATDALALEAARHAVSSGFDRTVAPVMRTFFYLPFEHSEDIRDQDRAVELFTALEAYPEVGDVARWAWRHREVIARFGRFPHRNRILGRPNTPEEEAFLREPGSSF